MSSCFWDSWWIRGHGFIMSSCFRDCGWIRGSWVRMWQHIWKCGWIRGQRFVCRAVLEGMGVYSGVVRALSLGLEW